MQRRASRAIIALSLVLSACGGGGDPVDPGPSTRSVSVTASGTGSGTVTSSPSGINCGSACSATFATSSAVSLIAAPASNSTFAGWSGACTGSSTSCTIAAGTSAASATAQFTLLTYTLTVALAGTGTGAVVSAPAGITCGSDCTEAYNAGQSVVLTATPTAGSTFTGWTGGGCTGTGTCTVSMNAATTITATFAIITNTLTVTSFGAGSGTVTSSPAGITCGADCSEPYSAGTAVTLTATPASNSLFGGWTGGGCTGTGPCTVTMNAATTVQATFNLQTWSLSVAKAGNGSGTVTSSPAGISCGSDCTEPYFSGTQVTLTAAATTGSTFTGWSGGGCTGTGSCIVTVTAATNVTATFTLSTSTLTVTPSGTGSGTVTSAPAGINCGADCSEPYNFGTSVVLTAAATDGSVFAGWTGGGCTGTGTCTITMNAATAVSATFNTIAARWPDSGTRFCGNLTAQVACPGGPIGQDGFYEINVPNYAVVGGRVQDPITGLVWERSPPTTEMTFATADAYCNNLVLDGATDWRLPTYLELVSIADFGATVPGFTTSAFPGIPQNSNYWTSTDRPGGSTQTFAMNTNYPTVTVNNKTAPTGHIVRCVRGTGFSGSLSAAGGSVTDSRTLLVWQSGTSPSDLNYSDALAYCEALVLDGNTDWRLPNGKELYSILDVTRTTPAISTVFSSRPATKFWSSSVLRSGPDQAYAINFDFGSSDGIGTPVTALRSVRCVR